MSARSEGARNLSNSVTGLINSGFNLASSIVDYKVDQKKREQILNSNKDVLETQYENEVGQLYQTLPESIDFSQYQTRIDSFNQDFISKAKSSGNYDEQTLSWLENEFMPGQTHKNEYALAGVTDYAVNTWLANNANSKANTLAADPNLSVEDASNQYRQYYNRVGLNNIENGANRYGYVTPEEFIEAIRGPKAVQAFERISSDPEKGYLFSKNYSMSSAMKQALDETGYSPNSIQESKFMSDCNTVLGNIEKSVKESASAFCDQVEGQYNELQMSPEFSSTVFDLTDAYEAAKNYPSQYLGDFINLAAKIEGHNADVNYDTAYSLVEKGVINDSVLDMLDSGYQATHAEKFRKLREEAVGKQIISAARLNGNNDAGQVLNWIYSGDVGITVTSEERFKAAEAFVSDLKSAYDTISTYDELANKMYDDSLAGSPVPDILSALYDVEVSYPVVSDDGTETIGTEVVGIEDITEGGAPENASVVFKPKSEFTFKPENKSTPLAERKISAPEEFSGKKEPLPASGTTSDSAPSAEKQTYSIPAEKDDSLPTVFTASGLNNVTDKTSSAKTGNAAVNNVNAEEEVKDLLKAGAPQELINSIVYYYEQSGDLSEEWISKNYQQAGWRENRSWGLIDGRVDDLAKEIDMSSSTVDNVKDRIKKQVVQAFRYSGQTWQEFEKSTLTKLTDMLYSQEMLSESMSQMELFNKVAQNADSYYETMTANGFYGQLFQDYASGKFDGIVDHGMIQKVQNMNIVGNDAIRNEFAKMMGHSTYKDAVKTDPTGMTKLMIESMTAVVNMHNEAKEFYNHVIDRLDEYGISASLSGFTMDKDLGYVFFDSNSTALGYALCIDPELMMYDTDSGISAQWKYVRCTRNSDGSYSIDKTKGSGDMGAYASVGSNLFVTTAKKPSDKEMNMEEEGRKLIERGEQNINEPTSTSELLRGWWDQLIGRAKTKTYKNQAAEEEATFIDAYRTAFDLWED